MYPAPFPLIKEVLASRLCRLSAFSPSDLVFQPRTSEGMEGGVPQTCSATPCLSQVPPLLRKATRPAPPCAPTPQKPRPESYRCYDRGGAAAFAKFKQYACLCGRQHPRQPIIWELWCGVVQRDAPHAFLLKRLAPKTSAARRSRATDDGCVKTYENISGAGNLKLCASAATLARLALATISSLLFVLSSFRDLTKRISFHGMQLQLCVIIA